MEQFVFECSRGSGSGRVSSIGAIKNRENEVILRVFHEIDLPLPAAYEVAFPFKFLEKRKRI